MSPLTSSPSFQRLAKQVELTLDDVRELTNKATTISRNQYVELRDAVDTYLDAKREMLASNVEIQTALETLRSTLESGVNALPESAQEGLEMAHAYARKTAQNAQAIGYRQWQKLTHPDATTLDRAIHVAGIGLLLYGTYRLARWAVSKEGDSWWWKGLKAIGLASAAAWAVNTLGPTEGAAKASNHNTPPPPSQPHKKQPHAPAPTAPNPNGMQMNPRPNTPPAPTPTPTKPNATPKAAAPAKTTKQAKAPEPSLLDSLPNAVSLLNTKAYSFELDGATHTIAFKTDGIYLDGRAYRIKAKGSVQLKISSVIRRNAQLELTAGAFWKSGTVKGDEALLRSIVKELLAGRTYQGKAEDGTTVEISPATP